MMLVKIGRITFFESEAMTLTQVLRKGKQLKYQIDI
jgi:hypothetical protein